MAKIKLSPEFLREFRELGLRWGKIAGERAARETNPDQPIDFADMEHIASLAAAAVIEGSIATLLEQHAQTLADELSCPECGTGCPVTYKDRPLTIETGQTFPLHEPVCHCPKCRRDFFPPPEFAATGQPRL